MALGPRPAARHVPGPGPGGDLHRSCARYGLRELDQPQFRLFRRGRSVRADVGYRGRPRLLSAVPGGTVLAGGRAYLGPGPHALSGPYHHDSDGACDLRRGCPLVRHHRTALDQQYRPAFHAAARDDHRAAAAHASARLFQHPAALSDAAARHAGAAAGGAEAPVAGDLRLDPGLGPVGTVPSHPAELSAARRLVLQSARLATDLRGRTLLGRCHAREARARALRQWAVHRRGRDGDRGGILDEARLAGCLRSRPTARADLAPGLPRLFRLVRQDVAGPAPAAACPRPRLCAELASRRRPDRRRPDCRTPDAAWPSWPAGVRGRFGAGHGAASDQGRDRTKSFLRRRHAAGRDFDPAAPLGTVGSQQAGAHSGTACGRTARQFCPGRSCRRARRMTVLQPDLPLAGAGALRLRWPLAATLALIPAGFVLIGLVIRYFGYAASVGDESIAGFPMGMCRWDCGWYIYIAEHGYHHFPTPGMNAAGNWAFFPLMPVFVGLVHMVLAMVPTMTLATGISILMAYVTSIIAWPLLGRDLKAYTIFSAYLLAGPWSIYFTTFMTEAAFILITTAALVALERRSYLSAGIAAGLLSATRIVGVFMSIAMAAQLLGDHIAARKPLRSFIPEILRRPDILLGLLLAPMGAFVYMAFLRLYVGDGLAFLHVQRAWARAYGNPLMFVWDALTDFPKAVWITTFPQQLAAAVITGFVL